MSVGDTTWLTRRAGDDFETGLFTYSAANTLTPTSIFESSNGNAPVSWSAGVKTLYCDFPASEAIKLYKLFNGALGLSTTQQAAARQNICAAPFDALAFNGMQFNGGMDISQENGTAAVAFASGTLFGYVVDGWTFFKSGTSALTVQQITSTIPGFDKSLKFTVTTAQASIGSDNVVIRNMIEGYRFARAQWGTASAQPVTIGIWVKSAITGLIGMSISNLGFTSSTGGTINVTASNTPQFLTLTIAGVTTGSWDRVNGAGAVVQISLASASPNMNFVGTNGNTMEITGFVLLPGIELPSAERAPHLMRPPDAELALCQRHLQIFKTTGTGILGLGVAEVSSIIYLAIPLPVSMRATPTITSSGPSTLAYSIGFTLTSPDSVSFSASPPELPQMNFKTGGGFIKVDARL
jgi:hypothetical protein